MGEERDPICCPTHDGREQLGMNQDGSVAKICRKTSRMLINLMKVCKHESSRMLSGKQEGTLNESLCAQAVSSTAHFTRLLFYSKSRRYRHITVNLKLEAGASESSPPSQSESPARPPSQSESPARPLSQSESPARPMPDSDASTSEIFMSMLREKGQGIKQSCIRCTFVSRSQTSLRGK